MIEASDKYNYYSSKNEKTRKIVQNYLKKTRAEIKQHHSFNMENIIYTEERSGYIENEFTKRLVLFLRGTGCSNVKENGGCTFCGFYNATNMGRGKISDQSYHAQVDKIIYDKKFSKYKIVCLYNDGSLLNDDEVSFKVIENIFEKLDRIDNVKKIVIESKVSDITEEKLRLLRSRTNKHIEIAVGFESSTPIIRDLCVNKYFEKIYLRQEYENLTSTALK